MRNPLRRFRLRRATLLAAAAALVLPTLAVGTTMAAPPLDYEVAQEMVRRIGLQRGVCAVLGRDGDVAREMARATELLIHVREPDAQAAAGLRDRADRFGLGIDRLAVERGPLDELPYADNLLDGLVTTRASEELLGKLSPDEVLRVLRPGGTAIVGRSRIAGQTEMAVEKLKRWVHSGAAEGVETWKDFSGSWVLFRKPALEGIDQWSHWEHGPDNNPVSTDRVIRAPYLTQFFAGPLYIGMPAITTAAGGRTFLAIGHIAHHRREWNMLNKLIARNGYNGTILWQRDLPEGYMVHRSAFIAGEETFHMIDGERCLLLDAQTGQEQGEIRIPGLEGGEWKWMAIQDGVLYVLEGEPGPGTRTIKGDRTFGGWSWADLSAGYYRQPRVPWGFGRTLAAYHLQRKEVIWRHDENDPIDSRTLAVGLKRLFLHCPDKHLRGLDLATGKVVWTNQDAEVLGLIEQPGRELTSTPGFRSCCLSVATPKALIVQGQTRMNVVAVSTHDGSLLWQKKKVTNNPNAIYVDGRVVLGVGPGGSHVALDPVTGKVLDDLKFRKVSCVRLTATPDSLFVRGEGTLRYDRTSGKVQIDGALRPACNDGALPASGMLYIGPWQCDCNLSLIGACAKTSAGEFRFDLPTTESDRLQPGQGDLEELAPLQTSAQDWPTYRADVQRSASTKVRVAGPGARRWQYAPQRPHVPTAPTSAGGLIFLAGRDGKVRALDGDSGAMRWQFATPGPILMPPTIRQHRAYFGCADGCVYALEAATGRMLWRFRAAPQQRHIMAYGSLGSTWPVHSGVLVRDGVAYFAAGIVDTDGTYVYALDAATGKVKWQNDSSGHLNRELRKGVSAQGNLTIQGDRLLLAGGNQVSPAPFDLATGKCLAGTFAQGQPKANHGRFVGVFAGRHAIAGGRILHSSPRNFASKGSFVAFSDRGAFPLNFGGVPPAWSEDCLALVNFRHGELTCYDAEKAAARIAQGPPQPARPARRFFGALADALSAEGAVRWQTDLGQPNKFEVLSLAVCPNAVVAVVQFQQRIRAHPEWFVAALEPRAGRQLWRRPLPSEPLPEGLLVDRRGQVVLTMLDGRVLCFGANR